MGRRGPAPTPSTVLKKRGSWRAKAGGEEPAPPPIDQSDLRPPPTLEAGSESRKHWKRLAPMLAGMGVFTKAERQILERYCVYLVRWTEAERFLAQNGMVYPVKDGNGKVKCFQEFPQGAISRQLAVELRRIEQELGLTPSARTRLKAQREDLTKGGQVAGLKNVNPFFLVGGAEAG